MPKTQKTLTKLKFTASSIRTLVASHRELPVTGGAFTMTCRTSDEQLKRDIRPL